MVGDTGSMLAGAGIVTGGVGGEIGGVALDATGVGALAGVPINVASAAAIVYGGGVAGKSAYSFGQDAKDLFVNASNGSNELRRPYIRKGVRQEVENRAEKADDGRFLDANEKTPIDGKYDLGHQHGNEHRVEVKNAQEEGLTQKEFNDKMNNPDLYQVEDPSINRSHKYERK
ncbi:HNH/ENDO VII family nuclease [Dehalobacter sp. TBBPA1]|uniref:HNH/ENDO VII family nuclease n=1 Tax=Dehalobacter sp. TBBPA1 TaxID=3235037 RepID=UPI0034A4BFF0